MRMIVFLLLIGTVFAGHFSSVDISVNSRSFNISNDFVEFYNNNYFALVSSEPIFISNTSSSVHIASFNDNDFLLVFPSENGSVRQHIDDFRDNHFIEHSFGTQINNIPDVFDYYIRLEYFDINLLSSLHWSNGFISLLLYKKIDGIMLRLI